MPSTLRQILDKEQQNKSALSPLRNLINLDQRDGAEPRLSMPEDQQLSPEEQTDKLFTTLGIRDIKTKDGFEFQVEEPSSTFVSPEANLPREPSYLESKVLPDLMNIAANLPVDMLNEFYKRVGIYPKTIPTLGFEGTPSGGIKAEFRMREAIEDADALLGLGAAVGEDPFGTVWEFVKNQPVAAAAIGYSAIRGGGAGVSTLGGFLKSRAAIRAGAKLIPKSARGFLVKDAAAVLEGKTAYADVFIPKAEAGGLAPQIRNVRKLAKSKGKQIRAVRSKDPDNPGTHYAVYDEKAMNKILAAKGEPKRAKGYLPTVLDDPQARSTAYVRSILKEGGGKGHKDIGLTAQTNFGDFLRSSHLVLQRLHPAGPELFRSVQGAVMESRASGMAQKAFRDKLYGPIKRKHGKTKLTEVMIDMERQAQEARAVPSTPPPWLTGKLRKQWLDGNITDEQAAIQTLGETNPAIIKGMIVEELSDGTRNFTFPAARQQIRGQGQISHQDAVGMAIESATDELRLSRSGGFSLDEALSPYPADVQQGVRAHAELMQTSRKLRIDEYIAGGMPEEAAMAWGFEGPYITRLFQGNYRIYGKPPGKNVEKAMFHSRTMTDGDAWSAVRKLDKQGYTDLRYDFDNAIPLEVVSRLPRKQLERLKALLAKNTGATREEVGKWLKTGTKEGGEITALAPTEAKRRFDRFSKRTLDDEFGNGEYDFWAGAEKDYEKITDTYIDATTRYISMSKARREFHKHQSKIPESMGSLRAYNEQLLNAVEGRRWSGSERFDQSIQESVESLNSILATGGIKQRVSVKPYALERWTGKAMSITANIKLGTPRAAIVNLTQTAQTLYPRVGQKVFWQAWKEASTEAGKKITRDAGITGTPTKFEGLLTKGGKTPKTPLYLFSKAEEKNRTVAYLAGRKFAQTKTGRQYARRVLGVDPADPDFAHKIGVDMVTATQFDLSAADLAQVFRGGFPGKPGAELASMKGPGPIRRVLTQFKPFQFKYIEHLAQLRKHPNPAKAYGRAALGVFTTGGARAMTLPLAPIKMAKYYGMFEVYKEIRDAYGETAADVFASGIPGALHMDLSYSLNVDIFPSFGNTAHEKLLSYFAGPTVSSILDAGRFAGFQDPDFEDFVATARRVFPQIKMGQGMKKLFEDEKWLRDVRGEKLARATGPEIAGRPLDLWMESLSFMTPRRRTAYEARYDLGRRDAIDDAVVRAQNAVGGLFGAEGTDPDKLAEQFERFAKE